MATIVPDTGDRQVNPGYMRYPPAAEGLKAAMQFPWRTTRGDKILIFDGGLDVRMLDPPFLYLDKNYVRILGGVKPALEAVAPMERPTVNQVRGELQPIDEEALTAVRGGATVIMVDTGDRGDLGMVVQALRKNDLRSSVEVAFSGNIELEDFEHISCAEADVLDIGYAILDAPCLPMRFDVVT